MNIKKKLSMSFTLMIAAISIISSSLLYQLSYVDESYGIIIHKNVPVEKYIEKIRGISLEQVEASTEEQVASMDSILCASEDLDRLAKELQKEVIKFKI